MDPRDVSYRVTGDGASEADAAVVVDDAALRRNLHLKGI